MPRKKRTIVEETLPDKPETGDDNITDYVCVLTKVYRLTNGERFFCFQTDVPVDEMSIANQFPAGGKFIVIEHNSEGSVLDTRAINIEAMGTNAQPNNGNGNGHHSEIAMLRDELLFSRSMTLKMIEGLFNKQNQPQQTPVAELIAGLQGLHALSGTGKDPYDMMVKGIELANKYGGNGNGGGDLKEQLIDAAKQILPPVINAFGSSRQPPPMMSTTGAQPMITESQDTMLKEGLKWLKSRIIAGQMSPDFAAEMLIQFGSTDERYQPILKTAISGTIDNFIAVDVEIGNQPFRDWFTAAIKTVKEWYAEQNNDDSDLDGTSGNNTNTKPNA